MADPDVAYVYERAQLVAGDLADWVVDDLADTASGPCPNCGHETTTDLQSTAIAQSATEGASATGAVRLFECCCNHPHEDGDQARLMCGRWWLATVFPDGHAPRIVPEADDTLLAAARALAQDQPERESRIRAAAEKWIAGVTALFGLFGLVGIITAKDAIVGVDVRARIVAGVFLLVAIISAAAALFQIYRAAYGFPKVVNVTKNEKLRQWFIDRQNNAQKAANNLRRGVFLSLLALVASIVSVGVIRYAPVTAPTPLVKVTFTDGSFVCGQLLDTITNGKLRVRRPEGSVRSFAANRIATSTNAVNCTA